MKLLFVFLCCIFLSACATKTLSVHAYADKHLNLDQQSHALPVVVEVYQLSDDSKFNQASFYELWENVKATLGSSLLQVNQLTVNPGETKVITFSRDPNAHYIAAMAIFRHPAKQDWRIIKEMPGNVPYMSVHISLSLKANKIFWGSHPVEVKHAA